jgi:ectoine hydroxylase-related dioxygenase (phytanoyl-CoA dioxygenase family)
MTPEDVLKVPPKVLSQEQREFYFENGYVLAERIIPMDWIERLRKLTDEVVEKSRSITKSDAIYDLEPGHTKDAPRLRRLSSPVEHFPLYWEFASQSVLADIAADLVGPDVKFHHSKLNFKWAKGGEEVKWHQDITYWPHTNYSPLTMGMCLYDVGPNQAPLGVIRGSHKGELFNQYNANGDWVGCLSDEDLARVALDQAEYLMGPAGSVTIHNCRTIHGSRPNLSDTGRPLLLNVYSAADAYTYTANPLPSRYEGAIVRGKPALWADHDPRPCMVPPDWSGGYTSLFALQQGEQWEEDQLEAVSAQTSGIRGRPSQPASGGAGSM